MAAKPSEAKCEQLSKALLWHILMYMPNGVDDLKGDHATQSEDLHE
jgi:hypothetical protein